MSEWIEYKLGSIVEVVNGFAFKSGDFIETGIPVIKIKNVKPNKILLDTLSYVSEEVAKGKDNYLIKENDILITMSGNRSDGSPDSWVGKVSQFKIKGTYLLNQRVSIIRVNEDIASTTYIAYNLSSWQTQLYLINQSNSSGGQANISPDIVKDIDISLPPLSEQIAIAEVLSSLDDKIDLLHRQNKTLEQLAETLFRQWFSTDVNSNSTTELGEYVDIINGVSYKSSELNPSKTAMVSLKSFDRNGGFRIDGFKEFTGKYKPQQVVLEGDLIVAHTDITQDADVIGNPALVMGNTQYDTLVISMDMVKVVPKADWISTEFLYYLMRTREFKGHCEGNANGSTVLHLSKKAIPTFEFIKPPEKAVQDYTDQARIINKKIFSNHRQIRNLSELRDSLLPKLMSGEFRVN